MHSDKDRRVFARFEANMAVRCRKEGGIREFFTATNNISGSGINMSLFKRVPPGSVLDLEIFKNGSDLSTKCRGQVVWVATSEDKNRISRFDAGIKFIDSDLMDISALINELNPERTAQPAY